MNTIITKRIADFRQAMAAEGISAAIIPHTDPHQSEYLAEHWEVRRWLSGFTGSAGTLVVTMDEALLWTDSRYFIQAAQQLEGTGIRLMKEGLPDSVSIEDYLAGVLVAGAAVGIDGMLFSVNAVAALKARLAKDGILLTTTFAPVDGLWLNRPVLPSDIVFEHDVRYAGETASDKIARVMERVTAAGGNALFISALDEIAWLLNVRSSDVECNPVVTAFLYLSVSGRRVLFIDEAKLDDKIKAYFEKIGVETAPYDTVNRFLVLLPSSDRVIVEPARTSDTLAAIIGSRRIDAGSMVAMLKTIKNPVQIDGIRNAMERDGVALIRLFMEIERALNAGEHITELDVEKLGRKFRSMSPMYFDDSFGMIAGYGPHGAIVHYSATEATNATLEPHGLLLVDSGAQYLDGTTDITRTVCLGTPTADERRDFTLVMKGHIALGSMVCPTGTRGDQLDALARQFLWQNGLNYLHGTGHGVGHFLNVHEGPQSIRLNHVNVPLLPGMLTSNEPGLYREGVHGIRCENLVLTVDRPDLASDEFGSFISFETMTLFPFDRSLFDLSIMSPAEVKWVDDYHATVRARLMPLLTDAAERAWLEAHTAPLA